MSCTGMRGSVIRSPRRGRRLPIMTAAMDWSRKAACRLWQRIATTCRVSRTGYALVASSEAPGAVAAD